jgi:hypothetical protein
MDLSRATGLGGDYTPAPEGNHRAVCVSVIDLGTQTRDGQFGLKSAREIMIRWELSDELMDDGRPYTIGKRYSYSMHERASLRKHLESWRGQAFTETDFRPGGFKIENLLGKSCLVMVKHSENGGKTYANVDGVSKLPKGMAPGAPTIEPYLFDLEDFETESWNALSDGLKRIVCASPEAQKIGLAAPASAVAPARAAAVTTSYQRAAPPRAAPVATVTEEDLDDEIPF